MAIQGLYYTKEHEWLKVDGKTATVGITDHAQSALGEITFVELPEIGRALDANGELAVVESSKAASDVYCPAAGKVIEVNDQLEAEPELVNNDCYGQGWIAKIEIADNTDLDSLMDADQYDKFLKGLE
jgi:glycine cleavage system H protein